MKVQSKKTKKPEVAVEVIDVENLTPNNAPQQKTPGVRLAEQWLGTELVQRVELARQRARDEFHARVADAHVRLNAVEKKASELVNSAITNLNLAQDRVLHVPEDAVHKFETTLQNRLMPVVTQWLKLPDQLREDVLTAAGVASAKQLVAMHEELAALRTELAARNAAAAPAPAAETAQA